MRPAAETLILETASRKIPLSLERGKGRRIRIAVLDDGRVRASVPRGVAPARVLAFAREKAAWIERAVRKSETRIRLHAPAKSAETGLISILGQTYPVKIEPGRARRAAFADGVLVVPVADIHDREAVRRRIESWLKRRAGQVLAAALDRGLEADPFGGLAAPPWSLRWMKRRWGSCGRDGRIVFNTRLVQTAPSLVEYVVLHELCHLKHHDHGASFYSLLARCLPDWKERRKALNAIAAE
ncbi:MAG: SprT family zinc-dependent metalloprotease [Acidobacteriota bacterium]|nr:SprT family zinc-dependent metalloprotease [Acidobacteriota bacterium]